MKLTHNVLCIDDDLDLMSRTLSAIEKKNAAVGVKTQFSRISVVRNTEGEDQSTLRKGMESELNHACDRHEDFHIVLIDLYMQSVKEKPVGGAFYIKLVRDNILYTPIIFYSGGNGDGVRSVDEQFQDYVRDRGMWKENLLVCERVNLGNFLEVILDEIHVREHANDIVRGFFMDRVSEIEVLVRACRPHFRGGHDPAGSPAQDSLDSLHGSLRPAQSSS